MKKYRYYWKRIDDTVTLESLIKKGVSNYFLAKVDEYTWKVGRDNSEALIKFSPDISQGFIVEGDDSVVNTLNGVLVSSKESPIKQNQVEKLKKGGEK